MTETKAIVDQIGELLAAGGRTLAVAESLTGGLLSAAFAEGDDASTWFRGGVVAYATGVKRDVLGVPAHAGVVTEECAVALARGAARLLGADVAVAVTGVGGPDPQDGEAPGTVWIATADVARVRAELVRIDGDPQHVCAGSVRAAVWAVHRTVSRGRRVDA